MSKFLNSCPVYPSFQGGKRASAYLQQSLNESQGAPWAGCRSSTGRHNHSHIHKHTYMQFIVTINQILMFLDCGKKSEFLERTHACTGRTPCRKTPGRDSNSGPSCCKATVLPTACSPMPVY
ncbi:hypothetical protein ILYODFUR_028907 [Ilyodon furcidens]|uniref:Uncharacterized protein n=1 Tax=Ilyodon furcidens TaxID=33524 RepID=A0ABV0TBX4_9TELE